LGARVTWSAIPSWAATSLSWLLTVHNVLKKNCQLLPVLARLFGQL
jgi:hypothetical protein